MRISDVVSVGSRNNGWGWAFVLGLFFHLGLVVCSNMVGCLVLAWVVSVIHGLLRSVSLLLGLSKRDGLLSQACGLLCFFFGMLRTWLLRLVIIHVCGLMVAWITKLQWVFRSLVQWCISLPLSWRSRVLFGRRMAVPGWIGETVQRADFLRHYSGLASLLAGALGR